MGDLTPFQNQVLDAAEQKEHEEQQRMQEEARQGNSPTRNARSNNTPSGGADIQQEESVRYINKNLNPEHEVHESE